MGSIDRSMAAAILLAFFSAHRRSNIVEIVSSANERRREAGFLSSSSFWRSKCILDRRSESHYRGGAVALGPAGDPDGPTTPPPEVPAEPEKRKYFQALKCTITLRVYSRYKNLRHVVVLQHIKCDFVLDNVYSTRDNDALS